MASGINNNCLYLFIFIYIVTLQVAVASEGKVQKRKRPRISKEKVFKKKRCRKKKSQRIQEILLFQGVYRDVFSNSPVSWVFPKFLKNSKKFSTEILISRKLSPLSRTIRISKANGFRVRISIHYLWIQDIFLFYKYVRFTFPTRKLLIILTLCVCSTKKFSTGISKNLCL